MIKVTTSMNKVTNVGKYLVFNKQNWVAVNYHSRNKTPCTKAFTDVVGAIDWLLEKRGYEYAAGL